MTIDIPGKERCAWCSKKINESEMWYNIEITKWNGDGTGNSIDRSFHKKCHDDIREKGVNFSI